MKQKKYRFINPNTVAWWSDHIHSYGQLLQSYATTIRLAVDNSTLSYEALKELARIKKYIDEGPLLSEKEKNSLEEIVADLIARFHRVERTVKMRDKKKKKGGNK